MIANPVKTWQDTSDKWKREFQHLNFNAEKQ